MIVSAQNKQLIWSVAKSDMTGNCRRSPWRHFTIRTDYNSLAWLNSFKQPEGQIARWLEHLQEYNFEVVHRKGRNLVIQMLYPDCQYRRGRSKDCQDSSSYGRAGYNDARRQLQDSAIGSVLHAKKVNTL